MGPAKKDAEDPLVFGEWDFGISMPEVVGDIDGDGRVELVAHAPQSDVSPTSFRVLRWTGNQFKPVFVKSLTGKASPGAVFSWTNKPSNANYWVHKWLGPTDGGWRVGLMFYNGTGEPSMAEGILKPSGGGYTLTRVTRKATR